MEIRVAIFEDNKLVRDALEAILTGTPGFTCTGVFADGNKWMQDIKRSEPGCNINGYRIAGVKWNRGHPADTSNLSRI